jgi:signal peptidase II
MIFRNIKYALVSVGVFLTDFCIKNHIEETRTEGEEKEAFRGRLLLRKYHNRGAFLDAGEEHSPLVAALSLGLTLAMTVVFLLTFGMKGGGLLKTGLALLLGGAYSNTYDRLRRHYVVDYVSFPVKNKKIRNVVFNISDFCIMIGALCMVLAQWVQEFKQ